MHSPSWIKNGVGGLGKEKARGRVTSVTVDMIDMIARNVPYITQHNNNMTISLKLYLVIKGSLELPRGVS